MRTKYVPYIVIGLVLVYLSIFGLEGFGLALTGDLYKEDFNTYTGWASYTADGGVTPRINPAGQLEQIAGTLSGDTRSACEDNAKPISGGDAVRGKNQYTVEFRMKADVWGSGANGPGYTTFMMYDDTYRWDVSLKQSIIVASDGKTFSLSSPTNNDWHSYYFLASITNAATATGTVEIYLDQTKIGSFNISPFNYPDGRWARISIDSWDGITMHADYVYIDTGLKPPGGVTTGTLRVFATYQGSYVAVPVTVTGPETKSGTTTTDPNNPLSFQLTPGSYTVSGTYAGSTQSVPATVVAGQTSDALLNFGGTPPPGKGYLRVFAAYQGNYIVTSVTVLGPESKSGTTTTDPNNPLRFELTVGSYTVSGVYSNNPQSQTVTVTQGATSDVTLNFGGTPPPPPPPPDGGTILDQILAKIKEIFRTPTVKQLLLVLGAGLAGIGGLMFILPEKHAPSPPPRYSY